MNSNICLLGASNSGKTCFVNKLVDSKISIPSPTIGVQFTPKVFYYDNKKIRWQIWDFGGFYKNISFLCKYVKRCSVFLIFIDMTIKLNKKEIEFYFETVYKEHKNPYIIIVCSKSDKSIIDYEDILILCEKYNVTSQYISIFDDSIEFLKNKINHYLSLNYKEEPKKEKKIIDKDRYCCWIF